jgi:hypothetical protein
MDRMEAGQARLQAEILEVKDHTETIQAECVVAATRAEAAMEIADAVRVNLGIGMDDE